MLSHIWYPLLEIYVNTNKKYAYLKKITQSLVRIVASKPKEDQKENKSVTCQLSPVTCFLSPVHCHLSPNHHSMQLNLL